MPGKPTDDAEQAEMAAMWQGEEPEDESDRPNLDGVEVAIEGDKAVVAPAEPQEPAADDEGKAELQRQYAVSQARAQEAERREAAERERAASAERTAANASVSMLDSAITAALSAQEKAQDKWAKAMEAGDFRTAAAAQTEIVDARYYVQSLHGQKQAIEAQIQAAARQQQQAPQQQPQGNPVEYVASGLERGGFPKSAAWLRAHSDMAADEAKFKKVQAAASYAENIAGLRPETPEYFDEIERVLGMRQAEKAPEPAPRRETPARAAPSAAAPRTPAPTRLNGQTERVSVSLTPRERSHARDVLCISDEEYAKEKYRLQQEGKLGGGRR